MTLLGAKVGGHGDNSFVDIKPVLAVGVVYQLFKDQRRDRFRSVFLPLEFERVFLTHVTLNQGARIVRVADLSLLGLAADVNGSVVVEVHNRGGSVVAYEVFDDFWNAKFVY